MNLMELEYLLTVKSMSPADKKALVERHILATFEGSPRKGMRLTARMAAALVGRIEQLDLLLAAEAGPVVDNDSFEARDARTRAAFVSGTTRPVNEVSTKETVHG